MLNISRDEVHDCRFITHLNVETVTSGITSDCTKNRFMLDTIETMTGCVHKYL